jgi:hypothetical protein
MSNFKNFDEWQVANYDVNPALFAFNLGCEQPIAQYMNDISATPLSKKIYDKLNKKGTDQQQQQLTFFQHLCQDLNDPSKTIPSSIKEFEGKNYFSPVKEKEGEAQPTPNKAKPRWAEERWCNNSKNHD